VRDGILLARRGRPAVALVTDVFVPQADFVSAAAGMPDIPRVVMAHPVAGSGDVAMVRTAAQIVPEIVAYLQGHR
jgi:hypothetical protein